MFFSSNSSSVHVWANTSYCNGRNLPAQLSHSMSEDLWTHQLIVFVCLFLKWHSNTLVLHLHKDEGLIRDTFKRSLQHGSSTQTVFKKQNKQRNCTNVFIPSLLHQCMCFCIVFNNRNNVIIIIILNVILPDELATVALLMNRRQPLLHTRRRKPEASLLLLVKAKATSVSASCRSGGLRTETTPLFRVQPRTPISTGVSGEVRPSYTLSGRWMRKTGAGAHVNNRAVYNCGPRLASVSGRWLTQWPV